MRRLNWVLWGSGLVLLPMMLARSAAAGPILLAMENTLNGTVQGFDPSTGAALGTFATLDPGYVLFSGMAAGNGDVYLAEFKSGVNTVFRYSDLGVELGSFNAGGNPLEDISVGSNGDLFVMSQLQNSPFQGFIIEYNPVTGAKVSFPAGGSTFTGVGGGARSMALAPNGNVLMGDQSGIGVYSPGDVLLDQITTGGTPVGLYVNASGDVYATTGSNVFRCPGCQAGIPGSDFAAFSGWTRITGRCRE